MAMTTRTDDQRLTDPTVVQVTSVRPAAQKAKRILAFATNGQGTGDEARLLALLSVFDPAVFAFDHDRKLASLRGILRTIRRLDPDLVCMEGTGIAGGLALIIGRLLFGTRFVVSSGDAIGPYVGNEVRVLKPLFDLYERLLYRLCSGFVGWTPYLVGRACSFGAPRAMTAEGWAPFHRSAAELAAARLTMRRYLGIDPAAIVIGIAGSIRWNQTFQYCYGLELVRAIALVERPNVHVLVVGGGNGLPYLEQIARSINRPVHLVGNVDRAAIPDYLAAMDIGSLPQTVDQVGAFRYSTKLSEYIGAGLPVVTGQLPMSYDLPGDWQWRLPGNTPTDREYLSALASLLQAVTQDELRVKREALSEAGPIFSRDRQIRRFTEFVGDLIMGQRRTA